MSLYDEFIALDVAAIDCYIASKQEENLHLEFKCVADSRLERDDRKNLAKALAGFANSDGGIVVWGVDTSQNAEGVDVASEKCSISPLSVFLAKLNQYTGEGANPAVDGVEHRKIETSYDSGFAVTFVPPSDIGPHMAKCGEDRYYKRSGDRFARMEHFEVADMFGRRPHPQLSVEYRLTAGSTATGAQGGTKRKFNLVIGIRNDGRGSARAPYLALRVKQPYKIGDTGVDGNFGETLPLLRDASGSEWKRYGSREGIYLHPKTHVDVARVSEWIDDSENVVHSLRFEYQLAADGVPLTEGEIKISVKELINTVRPPERDA